MNNLIFGCRLFCSCEPWLIASTILNVVLAIALVHRGRRTEEAGPFIQSQSLLHEFHLVVSQRDELTRFLTELHGEVRAKLDEITNINIMPIDSFSPYQTPSPQ